uniref:Uncharacterized protein n=1 Tax=Anguilla anguilla TaxID=7936 RepID=A0A0E9VU96_ANGAN
MYNHIFVGENLRLFSH